MKVQKFEEYSQTYIDMFCKDFLKGLLSDNIQEGNDSTFNDATFKPGFEFLKSYNISPLYNFINSLIKNEKVNTEITNNLITSITICATAIAHIEDRKTKLSTEEKDVIIREIKLELEEFRMQGVYGVVKKSVKCIEAIRSIFNVISKHIGKIAYCFSDIFNYENLLIPIIQILSTLIDKYKIDMETLPGILIGAGSGLTTLITNNFIVDLISKLKDRFNLKGTQVKDIEDELGAEEVSSIQPTVQKFAEFTPINDGELNNSVEND